MIIGASGHSKVVIDAYTCAGYEYPLQIRDDNPDLVGQMIGAVSVTGAIGEPAGWPEYVHIAIGDNSVRKRFSRKLSGSGSTLFTIVHPESSIANSASIGRGVLVAAKSVIGPDVELGDCVIVNHTSVVDHDCQVGKYTHIAPGAIIGGGCNIGSECLIGSGAILLPTVTIGKNVIVGSGAVVTGDIAEGKTFVGVPAKELMK